MSGNLEDVIAAHYALLKQKRGQLSPEEMITTIAVRMGMDAELELAVTQQAAGEWLSPIQLFVYTREYEVDS